MSSNTSFREFIKTNGLKFNHLRETPPRIQFYRLRTKSSKILKYHLPSVMKPKADYSLNIGAKLNKTNILHRIYSLVHLIHKNFK
jgi:hypothetical protein